MAAFLISPSLYPRPLRPPRFSHSLSLSRLPPLSLPPHYPPPFAPLPSSFLFDELPRALISETMDMSSESSTARWYEPPRSSLEPPSGGAGVAGVVGNPSDYRGYYPHAGPTAHHPAAAAAHYAHSKYTHVSFFSLSFYLCLFQPGPLFSVSRAIYTFFVSFYLPCFFLPESRRGSTTGCSVEHFLGGVSARRSRERERGPLPFSAAALLRG